MSTADTADRDEQQSRRRSGPSALLCILLGMLLGLVAVILLFFFYPIWWQAPHKTEVTVTLPDEFRDIQRARLQSLETERDRLLALLQKDPCDLPELIGLPPQKMQPDPAYGTKPLPPTDNDTAKKPPLAPGNGTIPNRAGTAPMAAQAPATVADLMDAATVFVVSIQGDGVGTGSGFFVAPGIVATNRHVVGDPNAKLLVGNKTLGGMQPAVLIAFSRDENRDYALLRVSDEAAAKAPVLKIAPSGKRTERVSAWGFPAFITNSDPKLQALLKGDAASSPEVVYSEGVISVVLDKKPPFIVHTAPLSQGNSGGPLINDKGVVVGINTMIAMAVKNSYSQSGVALPGGDLALFMQENGVTAATATE